MAQPTSNACSRCGTSGPKQTLLTSYVAYFMCQSCGAVWNVERSPDEKGQRGCAPRATTSCGCDPAQESQSSEPPVITFRTPARS
jgi:hypothetical protein